MTGYKHICNGFGLKIEGIEDSDKIAYWVHCNGNDSKKRYATIKESTKGSYFVANMGGCRVRQYLHDFYACL